MDHATTQRFDWVELEAWTVALLEGFGVSFKPARETASLLVRTDARGFTTHGLCRLPSYVGKLENGEVKATPDIAESFDAGFGTIDADCALGQVIGPFAVAKAIARTDDRPLAVYRLRNCGHLGALGMIVLPAAAVGRIAVIMEATPPSIGIPGASGAMLGNNPLALAAPRPDGPPIVIDFACSLVARGKVLAAARTGESIPQEWALDESGRPTIDANAALRGMLMPFGGHKGMMVSMMVEILAGALSGREFNPELNPVGGIGSATSSLNALLMVINPGHAAEPGTYETYMSDWLDLFRSHGGKAARIPGERAHRAELDAKANGVLLEEPVVAELTVLGKARGIPFPPAFRHRNRRPTPNRANHGG